MRKSHPRPGGWLVGSAAGQVIDVGHALPLPATADLLMICGLAIVLEPAAG